MHTITGEDCPPGCFLSLAVLIFIAHALVWAFLLM